MAKSKRVRNYNNLGRSRHKLKELGHQTVVTPKRIAIYYYFFYMIKIIIYYYSIKWQKQKENMEQKGLSYTHI